MINGLGIRSPGSWMRKETREHSQASNPSQQLEGSRSKEEAKFTFTEITPWDRTFKRFNIGVIEKKLVKMKKSRWISRQVLPLNAAFVLPPKKK